MLIASGTSSQNTAKKKKPSVSFKATGYQSIEDKKEQGLIVKSPVFETMELENKESHPFRVHEI